MAKKKGIVVIERYERDGLVAYSLDEGKTYHETVEKAKEHYAKTHQPKGIYKPIDTNEFKDRGGEYHNWLWKD
jgi:predicted lactoylglutathione lyase